ncbi:calcium and integrin-binding protein 1-like [Euwallacea fornicatus]|uniref:calcium and integrin-binding protein 1-like n=1 Tax=Euwallacea fornicatus TaxID=995702 RepID=UPI00338FC50E
MGSSKSKFSALTEAILEEYSVLTYLSKAEILHIYKVFGRLDPNGILQDVNYRFSCRDVEDIFTQLKYNPFKDRIFSVFSSEKDECMSFEDILDLCSVMSEKCPYAVKAAWAFRIFDFDEDGYVGENDLAMAISRMARKGNEYITEPDQMRIIKVLMDEINIESSGKISVQEFIHSVGKMSEFPHSFCFRF